MQQPTTHAFAPLIGQALAQLIALHKTSELPVDKSVLYLWGVIIVLNCFVACAPWFEKKHSMNLLKTILYLDAVRLMPRKSISGGC